MALFARNAGLTEPRGVSASPVTIPHANSVVNDDAGCSEEYHPGPIPPQPQGLLFQE
jgi:hypothetical protein